VNYGFLIVWSILLYALFIQKNIVSDQRFNYLNKIFTFYNLFLLTDLFLNVIIYLNGLSNSLFNENIVKSPIILKPSSDFQLLFIILSLIMVLYLAVYVIFVFKRSLRLMQQYWFMLIILLIGLVIYAFNRTFEQLGIFSNAILGIKLLTWNYYFVGWIILGFFAITLSFNICGMIVFAVRDKVIDGQYSKNSILTFIKLGFITTVCLMALILLPEAYIYFSWDVQLIGI
jgi:hypothetical protein